MASESKTDRRFRVETTAILAAALIAALSGIGGAAIGAHASSAAILDQLAQERQVALRSERYEAFSKMLIAADEVQATVTQFPQDGEPYQTQVQQAFDSAYQTAYLYGSIDQVDALNKLSDALDALALDEPTDEEQRAYTTARADLLVLLRDDLQFDP